MLSSRCIGDVASTTFPTPASSSQADALSELLLPKPDRATCFQRSLTVLDVDLPKTGRANGHSHGHACRRVSQDSVTFAGRPHIRLSRVTDRRNRAAVVSWVSALLAAALLIGVLAVVLFERLTGNVEPAGFAEGVLSLGLGVLAFAIVGALIVTRRPRHPIGWIYTASGLLIAVAGFSLMYSRLAQQLLLPFAPIADAVFGVTFFAGFLLPITLGLLLFPDGHFVSRGWRAAVLITVIGYVGAVGQNGLVELALPAAILASVASLILRWHRAVGTEREQLKWVGAAALLVGLDLIAVILLASFDAIPTSGGITFVALAIGIALVPVAVGIAILRYRLYDIDVLINRTLVYGALSAVLAATYFLSVLALETLLRPITAGSELSVALSTLAVVALFAPLRRRLQAAVDRRFYRQKYDAERMLDAFSARLRDEVDLDAVRRDLIDAVERTVRPAHASVWLGR